MLKFKNKTLLTIVFLLTVGFVYSQITTSDLAFSRKITEEHSEELETVKGKKGFFLFKGYKLLLSSQDVPNICRFNPSCSKYGILQINKNGMLIGTLATFDRLTRCNGLQKETLYNYDRKSNLFEDYP